MNIVWKEPGSGKTKEDVLLAIQKHLWNENEDKKMAEYQSGKRKRKLADAYVTKEFSNNWYPKEWLVFLHCGAPAGSRALPSFVVEKSNHSGPGKGVDIEEEIIARKADIRTSGGRALRRFIQSTTPQKKDGNTGSIFELNRWKRSIS